MTTILTETELKPIHPSLGGDNFVPLFVYGTLRVGQGHWSWASKGVRYEVQDCTAPGQLYWSSLKGMSYPVALFNFPGQIKGDVLWFDRDSQEWKEVFDMEVQAGYKLVEIEAKSSDGQAIECFGFNYLRVPQGDWIASGDWATEVENYRRGVW